MHTLHSSGHVTSMLLGLNDLRALILERDHPMLLGNTDSTWSSGGGIVFCTELLFVWLVVFLLVWFFKSIQRSHSSCWPA